MTSEVKAANGAVVLFNNTDVKVAYSNAGSRIAKNKVTTPTIYIPVTNPASTTLKLNQVKIDFTGGGPTGNEGQVTDFDVYYGSKMIYETKSEFKNTTTLTQTVPSDYKIADSDSYGILVTIYLNLPDSTSTITLNSVDLTFSTPST